MYRTARKLIWSVKKSSKSKQVGPSDDEILEVTEGTTATATWARTEEAKKVITSLLSRLPTTHIESDSVEDYLSKREYFGEVGSSSNGSSERSEDKELSKAQFLSAILTFPLSLSYMLQRVLVSGIGGEPGLQKSSCDVMIVGARSESSLPRLWWREAQMIAPLGSDSLRLEKINLSMVGPQLIESEKQKWQRQQHSGKGTPSCLSWEGGGDVCFDTIPSGKAFLHDIDWPTLLPIIRKTDAFVLFNPGFGHEALRDQWKPTLSLLLQTRKPVLCTALSKYDLDRDLAMIQKVSDEEDHQELGEPLEMLFAPVVNPFASLKRAYDPKEDPAAQITTTNQYVYAFRSK